MSVILTLENGTGIHLLKLCYYSRNDIKLSKTKQKRLMFEIRFEELGKISQWACQVISWLTQICKQKSRFLKSLVTSDGETLGDFNFESEVWACTCDRRNRLLKIELKFIYECKIDSSMSQPQKRGCYHGGG